MGWSPLVYAVSNHDSSMVKELLKKGANPNVRFYFRGRSNQGLLEITLWQLRSVTDNPSTTKAINEIRQLLVKAGAKLVQNPKQAFDILWKLKEQ